MRVMRDATALASTGETSLPKAARQALGITGESAVRFVCQDKTVSVVALGSSDMHDLLMAPFLALIEQDLCTNQTSGISQLDDAIVASLLVRPADLNAPITGSVGL